MRRTLKPPFAPFLNSSSGAVTALVAVSALLAAPRGRDGFADLAAIVKSPAPAPAAGAASIGAGPAPAPAVALPAMTTPGIATASGLTAAASPLSAAPAIPAFANPNDINVLIVPFDRLGPAPTNTSDAGAEPEPERPEIGAAENPAEPEAPVPAAPAPVAAAPAANGPVGNAPAEDEPANGDANQGAAAQPNGNGNDDNGAPADKPAITIKPAAPGPKGPPPAIVPLGRVAALPATGGQVETRVFAKKKPPEDPNLFAPVPDNTDAYPLPSANGAPPAAPIGGGIWTGSAGSSARAPLDDLPRIPPGAEAISGYAPLPGLAQNAAAPLRRALMQDGVADVLSSPSDSVTVRRVINEHLLSIRVVGQLQQGMASLVLDRPAKPADPAAIKQDSAKPAEGGAPATVRQNGALDQTVLAAARLGQALGYRCVVLLAVNPSAGVSTVASPEVLPPAAGGLAAGHGTTASTAAATPALSPAAPVVTATYTVVVVDALRGSSDLLELDGSGPDWISAHESVASTEAAWLMKRLSLWTPVLQQQKMQLASAYLGQARQLAPASRGDALDLVSQALALGNGQPEAYSLQGDLLRPTDPAAAAQAYQHALEAAPEDTGPIWEKIAVAYAAAKDWPHTLQAAGHALAVHRDTATLRLAMATAQLGRADLFRAADHTDSADDAEADGREQLERAHAMDPDNPEIVALMAKDLVTNHKTAQALALLDPLMAKTTPNATLQELYASTLADRDGREVDAFMAYAMLWKMTGTTGAPVTAAHYRRLAEGFDEFVSDLARQAAQQASGVADGSVPREAAVQQLGRLASDMHNAEDAIHIMQPPATGGGADLETIHAARIFAADLLHQAITAYGVYAETGDEVRRSRAFEMHRQAINQLNAARTNAG